MKKILSKWYFIIIGGFILFAAAVYILTGQKSVIAVHDNLDLFIPQYKMMKDTGTFFAHGAAVPFLGNISRDYLPSEFNLYTVIFMIFPELAAYIICYFLKIFIALAGSVLFARDVLGEKFSEYASLVYLSGFAYGILNLFPNFGIAFAAIPLLLFIMHKIVTKPNVWWFVALFCYPFISYFSYLGIFFIGYMCIYFVYSWISRRKFPWQVFISIPILSFGFFAFEYRLFMQMLFSDVESIRSTMVITPMDAGAILLSMWEGFSTGDMHTEAMQQFFVMPVCLIYFVVQTIIYIKNKEPKKIFTDCFNGVLLFIFCNSVIYGLYYFEPLRTLFGMIVPPLKGFEFGRTAFTTPFLWYVAFFLVCKRMYDLLPKLRWVPNVMLLVAIFIIVLGNTRYNDLYHTCYEFAYEKMHDGNRSDALTYEEFYSEALFDCAKADINYNGEQAVAYGLYPAILEYNGIATLDGYLGYYSQAYKDDFRKIIAPALARVPESASYFDNWGARCYMYSGSDISNVTAGRYYPYEEEDIYIDVDAFASCGGKYIFSRPRITNAREAGLNLVGTYTDDKSTYTINVYELSDDK